MNGFITLKAKIDKLGKLSFSKEQKSFMNVFLSDNVEKDIDITIELATSEKSLAQLAKIHVCLKTLSDKTGYDVSSLKDMLKSRAELFNPEGDFKSLRDCSKVELNNIINEAISLGDFVGLNLR